MLHEKRLPETATTKTQFAIKNAFTLENLILMALMAAIAAVLSRFSIYLTPTFRAITFTYLPGVITAALCGPWCALAYGFVSDALQYFANPQGGYFPGYALSEMLSCLIYALFLYGKPVKLLRVAAARLVVLVLVTMGLNYVWMNMMYGTLAGGFYTGARLINNLVQFPFHVAIIMLVVGRVVRFRQSRASG
ncbi:MAG: folate family ECF transporter S component [Clostridiales Family XIII bacterium]|jgi:ECF transporter S component (folate family)|nr:folate family ECF transporter S component [Clostridiales Family XIII bacterium]